ncbi:MAG: sulfatase-like hydrolase/transferase [Chloroflexota bacterium]
MSKNFNGTISLDIRDSVPDWEPYAEKKAKPGSPNILYIVLDDTGLAAWEMFGGLIKMPNLKRIADEGLLYTNFHTTALCSPTRSSLLNGRNATSNGMSCIEEATTGFPGNNGRIPFENAFISSVLSERGYNTYALGKWHLLPEEEAHMAATKRNWPLGRGFERYYGFLGGETDQWYPDIVYDNHIDEAPYGPSMTVEYDAETLAPESFKADGYHLSKDLADKAISFIQDSKAIAPDKPWMMYFCPGANHAPHQIWPEMILKYGYNTTLKYDLGQPDSFENHSVFKDGYNQYRKDIREKMQELGILGDDVVETIMNPHNEPYHASDVMPTDAVWPQTDWVKPWDAADVVADSDLAPLTPEEKALFIRMAEIYAAFSTYTDEQIGRILDFLRDTGQWENTIIMAMADNGASAEGGPSGSVNENLFFNDIPDNVDNNVALLEKLGTLETYNHYPTGWAWAFDSPYKYWKRWSGYEGGAVAPFMICGPGISPEVDPLEAKKSRKGKKSRKDKKRKGKKSRIETTELTNLRKQYVHAADVVPTLYDLLEIEPPEFVKGYKQNPLEGISFKYTFNRAYENDNYTTPYRELPEPDEEGLIPIPDRVKESQFYSMLGTRGMWHRGWQASTVHPPTPSNWGHFDEDTWELYCMDGDTITLNDGDADFDVAFSADPAQAENLVAAGYTPTDSSGTDLIGTQLTTAKAWLQKKLTSMQSMWFAQAGLYKGMPLDDRSTAEVLGTPRPQLTPTPFEDDPDNEQATFSYVYYPNGSEIPESVAPNVRTRSFEIAATLSISDKDLVSDHYDAAVLFAHGGRFGGHSLYLRHLATNDIHLCYVYNWLGQRVQLARASIKGVLNDMRAQKGDLLELKVNFAKQPYDTPSDSPTGYGFDPDIYGGSTVGDITLTATIIPFDDPLDPDIRPRTVEYHLVREDPPANNSDNWKGWETVPKLSGGDYGNAFITQPGKFALAGEGMNIGRDGGQAVSIDYEDWLPAEFEGMIFKDATIKNVVVTIHNDAAEESAELAVLGMLWRD